MSNAIRIADLANPELNETQKAVLSYGETLDVKLDADDILKEAAAAVSLDDFGDMAFMVRLELLCDEWGGDAELNNTSKLGLRNKLLLYARNRLLIRDFLKRHPQIHDIEIQKPIVVVGLPRSGTTHLLNLMAADRRLRALPLWQSYEPLPMPGEETPEGGRAQDDPRYKRCADAWKMMQTVTPLLAIMHPMNPEHIHEELELMGPDFASYNFEWLCPSPRWRDHYYATDQTPHYEYMKTVLKILTWQDGDKDGSQTRWVLKCPQHLEQLPALRAVFPDATIVVTHRDPVSVIQSACTMIAYGQRMSRHRIDMASIANYWSDRIMHLLKACVEDRAKAPASQSIDVPFDEFMADDIAMVRKIYAKAELDMNEEAMEQLGSFMEKNRRGQHGRIIYDLEGDFGVDPARLRSRFDFYFERFSVRAETQSPAENTS